MNDIELKSEARNLLKENYVRKFERINVGYSYLEELLIKFGRKVRKAERHHAKGV
jgi:hypothetical protein